MYYLLLVFILIFFYEKLYSNRYDFYEECVFIARGLFISVILIAVLVYLSRSYEIFTRTLPILMMFTAMFIVPLVRWGVKRVLRQLGFLVKHTAVIGIKEEMDRVIPVLQKSKTTVYAIDEIIEPDFFEGEYQIRDLSAAGERGKKIETVVIVSKGIDKQHLNDLINYWENGVKEIKIVSDSSYLKTIGVETEYVDELLIMRMANNILSPVNRFFKRIFDIGVSFVSTVILFPFFCFIALSIKLDSRGPVFFTQERFGKGGKIFKILKFRTMVMDCDRKLNEYLSAHPELQEEWDQYKKLKTGDPRVTKIGKFLRRFSLDEFPQILNVLRGNMSIVGPRPYLIREKEEIEKSAAIIFRVKSGLTGLWQIKGRNELSFESRLKLDEFYVRNWSFLLDITIILRTFGVVLKGKGAY